MPTNLRPKPAIPDHEVLRKIGGGAYGEVWLARGVTGALRAVKVVYREDFEDERGFEREFEGILKFEPISRDHPGLVHILHVGRSPDETSFYYYVMELGDDVSDGRDINPVEYEPRTLRADNHQAKGERWDTNDCIEIGIRLADALDHLHERGLAHRDVKPSNVIFVKGKAKLADIGLVAARGQRTFVGTEGFVPPEGPGSARADVYSLGKVLYEIATGNDRLNFPELPANVPLGLDRKRWLELNRVICEVCEPRLSKRKIFLASELANSLRRIQRGRRRRGSGVAVWATSAVLLSFSGWIGWEMVKDTPLITELFSPPPPPKPKAPLGLLRIFSSPEGADVIDENGTIIGTTPTPVLKAPIGKTVRFTLQKREYRSKLISEIIPSSATEEPFVISSQMEVFSPPLAGEIWTDQLGETFLPVTDYHESATHVTKAAWELAKQSGKLKKNAGFILNASENGQPSEIILCDQNSARAFCNWFREEGIEAGYLTEDHEISPIMHTSYTNKGIPQNIRSRKWSPFRIKVRRVAYADLIVQTEPPGAQIYINGKSFGETGESDTPHRLKPGSVQILLLLDGFKPLSHTLQIDENATKSVTLPMQRNQSVVFNDSWENSLRMVLVPMRDDLMVSIWETRLMDYRAFLQNSRNTPEITPAFEQTDNHPVVNVSRTDARAFCKWLTKKERSEGRITGIDQYRLPTDLEWSLMVGLDEEEGISPSRRDSQKAQVFPWGARFDPIGRIANLADATLADMPDWPADKTIPGYNDEVPFTAPVGSFPPTRLGDFEIFDLAGNVHEWVDDDYTFAPEALGVLRGGGWNTYQMENLYAGSRNAQVPDFSDSFYGFRVVLARKTLKTPEQEG